MLGLENGFCRRDQKPFLKSKQERAMAQGLTLPTSSALYPVSGLIHTVRRKSVRGKVWCRHVARLSVDHPYPYGGMAENIFGSS